MKKGLVLAVLWWVSSSTQADFVAQKVAEPIEGIASVTESSWVKEVSPGGQYDRIGVHLYKSRRAPNERAKAALLYLPGTNMNGEMPVVDESYNLWLYLAARGIDVYALSYRTHFVPNEPVPDLGFMKAWTLDAFVGDAALAFDHIRLSQGQDTPVFVAGFSRGVTYAYALAGQRDVAGLIVLDGSFKRHEPGTFDRSAAMKRLADSGEWGSVLSRSRGWGSRSEMMRRVWDDPNGPAMGKFDNIGAQLTETLYNAWGPGVLANPVDGISDIRVLARVMEGYDRTFPTIQNIEGQSIALLADDPDTTLDDHFGEMTVPVIYFGATNMGADNLLNGIYSASKSGSKDVTINVLENHGHVDVLYGNQVKDTVFAVIASWMMDRITNK